jgi:hypothetical protein
LAEAAALRSFSGTIAKLVSFGPCQYSWAAAVPPVSTSVDDDAVVAGRQRHRHGGGLGTGVAGLVDDLHAVDGHRHQVVAEDPELVAAGCVGEQLARPAHAEVVDVDEAGVGAAVRLVVDVLVARRDCAAAERRVVEVLGKEAGLRPCARDQHVVARAANQRIGAGAAVEP